MRERECLASVCIWCSSSALCVLCVSRSTGCFNPPVPLPVCSLSTPLLTRCCGHVVPSFGSAFNSHLMGFFYRTIRMVEQGIKPMYVFDGKPPDLKAGVVRAVFYMHSFSVHNGTCIEAELTSSTCAFLGLVAQGAVRETNRSQRRRRRSKRSWHSGGSRQTLEETGQSY